MFGCSRSVQCVGPNLKSARSVGLASWCFSKAGTSGRLGAVNCSRAGMSLLHDRRPRRNAAGCRPRKPSRLSGKGFQPLWPEEPHECWILHFWKRRSTGPGADRAGPGFGKQRLCGTMRSLPSRRGRVRPPRGSHRRRNARNRSGSRTAPTLKHPGERHLPHAGTGPPKEINPAADAAGEKLSGIKDRGDARRWRSPVNE
jgi:hypothetical protein